VAELKQQTGAEVAIHEADADYLAGTKPIPKPKGLTGLVFRGISGMFRPGPVRPDVLIHDQDAIAGLSCVHTPGHTPGSSCFLERDRRVLFAGDTIICRNGKIEGPPAQFTPDREQANRSIEKIATFDFETLLSGHGEPLTSAASTRVREFVQQGKK
jgi:glyoxylase-like metal-dependent hydrolase (beta-lactamase superfamily II)